MAKFLSILFFLTGPAYSQAADVAPVSSSKPRLESHVQSCQAHLASPTCQKFEGREGLLKPDDCKADIQGDNWSVLSRLENCGKGLAFSAKDFLSFLWEAVKFIATAPFKAVGGVYNYITDGDSRSSTHQALNEAWQSSADYLQSIYPYLATEYQKAYDQVGAPWNLTEASKSMRAAMTVRSKLVAGLMSAFQEIIKAKYSEFHCFDNNKQVEMTCKLVGDLFFPPAAAFGLLKYGVKGLKSMPNVTSKLDDMLLTKFAPDSAKLKLGDEVDIDGEKLRLIEGGPEGNELYKKVAQAQESGTRTYVREPKAEDTFRAYVSQDEKGAFIVINAKEFDKPKNALGIYGHELTHVKNSRFNDDTRDVVGGRLFEGKASGVTVRSSQLTAAGRAAVFEFDSNPFKSTSLGEGYGSYARVDEVHARAVEAGVNMGQAEKALLAGDMKAARSAMEKAKKHVKGAREFQSVFGKQAEAMAQSMKAGTADVTYRYTGGMLLKSPTGLKIRLKFPRGMSEKAARKEALSVLESLQGKGKNFNGNVIFERQLQSLEGRIRTVELKERALTGKFSADEDRFISYSRGSGKGRGSGRIVGYNHENRAVIIEDISNSGLIRREMTEAELASARVSKTAAKNYEYVSQNVKTPAVPGVREPSATQLVKKQFESQPYRKDDAPRVAFRNAYEERFQIPTNPELTNIARAEGRIVEHRASSGAKLKEGAYTYVITDDGRLITGQVEDVFEFGVKHSNIARGRKIVSAGEIQVRRNGSYSFNNESGSYAAELIKERAVTAEDLRKRTEESLKVYFGETGKFEKRILLPETEPTRNNLIGYCGTRSFLTLNREACCKVVRIGCN